jgi:hypothetical protein
MMIRPYDVRVYRRFRAATRAAHGTTLPCWARNASLLRSNLQTTRCLAHLQQNFQEK